MSYCYLRSSMHTGLTCAGRSCGLVLLSPSITPVATPGSAEDHSIQGDTAHPKLAHMVACWGVLFPAATMHDTRKAMRACRSFQLRVQAPRERSFKGQRLWPHRTDLNYISRFASALSSTAAVLWVFPNFPI